MWGARHAEFASPIVAGFLRNGGEVRKSGRMALRCLSPEARGGVAGLAGGRGFAYNPDSGFLPRLSFFGAPAIAWKAVWSAKAMPDAHMLPDSISDAQLLAAADALAHYCRTHGLRIVAAESCTGGWLARCCTDLPGSSDWFECGWVAYSNAAKSRLLGVAPELIEQAGAVSQETVEAMAAGALERTGGDRACAISGVAGPGGGTPRTPVGCIWFAFLCRGGEPTSERQVFSGTRESVRCQAVLHALRRLGQDWA